METPVKLRVPGVGAAQELSPEVRRQTQHLGIDADIRDVVKEDFGEDRAFDRRRGGSGSLCESQSSGGDARRSAERSSDKLRACGRIPWIETRVSEGKIGSSTSFAGSVTENLHLRYISAFAARNSLPEFMMRYVQVDADENALTVSGPQRLVDKLRADLKKLDVPIPQIEMETTAVEFNSSKDLEAMAALDGRIKGSEIGMNTSTGDMKYIFAGPLPDTFNAQLHALETGNRATIRAHAKTTVLSGQTADLFVGSRQLVQVQYFDYLLGAYTGRLIALDLGVTLHAQPWSGAGGTIMVAVQPTVTSVVAKEVGTGLPTVSTRTANATLRLQDGETVIVGGLGIHQDQKLRSGVPDLAGLGLLGIPFQSPHNTRSDTDLVFFITARIVPGKPYVPSVLRAAPTPALSEKHA